MTAHDKHRDVLEETGCEKSTKITTKITSAAGAANESDDSIDSGGSHKKTEGLDRPAKPVHDVKKTEGLRKTGRSVHDAEETEDLSRSQKPDTREDETATFLQPSSGRQGSFVEGLDDNDDEEPEALDGGWAYVVLLGTFGIMVSVGTISNCYSILFLDFLNDLGTPSSMTAAIYNTESFLWSGANLLGGALAELFGWRIVAMIGGLLIAAGFSFSAFATSAPYLFFSHALLTGFGSGLCCLVAYSIIPFYFKRMRGRANGLMAAGVSIGGMLGPPIITFLQNQYTFRGATLIVAAFMLHNCVSAMVFHPVAWHKRKQNEKGGTSKDVSSGKHLKANVEMEFSSVSTSPKREDNDGKHVIAESGEETERNELLPFKTCDESNNVTNSNRQCNNKSDIPSKSKTDVEPKLSKRKSDLKTILVAVFKTLLRNIGILRYFSALIISVGGSFVVGVCLNIMMIVPFAMVFEGYTQEQASWGLSVSNVFSLLARFIVSPLGDLPFINIRVLFIVSTAALMISIIMICFTEGIVWVNVSMGMFGFTSGSCLSLYPLVMVQSMGVYKYTALLGVTGVINGLWLVASGPLFGVIRDVSGSYTVTMMALGSTSLITIIFFLFLPAALTYDKAREKQQGTGKSWGKGEQESREQEV